MTALVLALTGIALALSGVGWTVGVGTRAHLGASAVAAGLAGLAGLLLLFGTDVVGWADPAVGALVLLAALLAVVGGGPAAVAVLHLVDREPGSAGRGEEHAVEDAGEVLRGGAWIGVLERAGIFGTLVAGWPEGLAVVLAVKGVGRYSELRMPGAAERFIIGTFVSVLWAAGCAALVFM